MGPAPDQQRTARALRSILGTHSSSGGTQPDAIHTRPTQISRFRLLSLLIVIYSKPKAKSPK
jgi:hypothetical protein